MTALGFFLIATTTLTQLSTAIQQNNQQDIVALINTLRALSQMKIVDEDGRIINPYDTYLDAMRDCESDYNDKAINPKDTDGTPSWGRYQFKIGTLLTFGKKYGFFSDTATRQDAKKKIFDGEFQEKIFIKMIDDPDVNLKDQFPACHRRNGYLLK